MIVSDLGGHGCPHGRSASTFSDDPGQTARPRKHRRRMTQATWRDRRALGDEGLSKNQIDNAIRRGRLHQLTRGVLVPALCQEDLWQRCSAALSTQHPEAAVSRRTAAVARRFAWLPANWSCPDTDVCVDAPRSDLTRSARSGLDRRIAALPPEDVVLWRGLRVTNDARTGVDLARYEPRDLAVPVLDWLLTAQRCTREELVSVCDRMVRVPHVRRARRFIDLARPGVDSPRESHTRLHIIDADLPEPDVNLQIREEALLLAQGDLGYWRWLIWIDYDGRDVHELRRLYGQDQRKDRWLGRRGWEVFRLTNRDHHEPSMFLSQLRRAIADAPARIAALSSSRSPEVAAARIALGIDPRPQRS